MVTQIFRNFAVLYLNKVLPPTHTPTPIDHQLFVANLLQVCTFIASLQKYFDFVVLHPYFYGIKTSNFPQKHFLWKIERSYFFIHTLSHITKNIAQYPINIFHTVGASYGIYTCNKHYSLCNTYSSMPANILNVYKLYQINFYVLHLR